MISVSLGTAVNVANNATLFGLGSQITTQFVAVVADAAGAGNSVDALNIDVSADQTVFLQSGANDEIDNQIKILDSALAYLRSNAQTIGSNVALLQTRLDFTEIYVNELESGGSKLTLADINEEGANLLALQTRQQLGISALAFAGQAEQGILALFR